MFEMPLHIKKGKNIKGNDTILNKRDILRHWLQTILSITDFALNALSVKFQNLFNDKLIDIIFHIFKNRKFCIFLLIL